jgi:predicted membrane channel-forming protein YqfA (hemolysin III family)
MTPELQAIAPHVDPTWREELVLELRLHDVPGDAIGGALAEVEAHCVDSGEDAQEAFGDARTYAATLARATGRRDDEPLPLRTVGPAAAETVGIMATTAGAVALLRGQPADLHLSALVLLLLVGVALVGVVRRPTPVLRRLLDTAPWRVALASLVLPVVVVAVYLLAPDAVLPLPAAPLTALGLALLTTGTVLHLTRGPRLDDDPILPPAGADTPDGSAASGRTPWQLRLLMHADVWGAWVTTAVLVTVLGLALRP